MLTKDLLRFRSVGGAAKPQFIDPADPALLRLAAKLLECYRFEEGESVSARELEEQTAPLVNAAHDRKLSKGLNKIILDRCQFSLPDDYDYAAHRRDIFLASAQLLRHASPDFTPDALRHAVGEAIDPSARELLQQNIYADLPGNEMLSHPPAMYPRELLERYNCALVQSLLLYSGSMEVTVTEPEPAKMRRLFHYLRFFRLLAKITAVGRLPGKKSDAAPTELKMEIDGPASLFDQSTRYGLQLASFFPSLCTLAQWKLKTVVKPREKELKLTLDQSCGLVSPFRNHGAYVPEEFGMFEQLFKEKCPEWTLAAGAFLFQRDTKEVFFPDFSFKDGAAGPTLHLELFHRWHDTPLLRRLEYLDQHPEIPMIIGVDRALSKRPELASRLDASPFFKQSGFLFRDFPGVDTVEKTLRKKLAALQTLL